eukprot:TRINITY_DN28015_c0_g1_i2.p1 TRINITY_DN28015_c0_g1~~TRINITY_DN28015_c0_g1_i2.p1  ORF type:complete len:189 (+),score=36.52 TRINITY_DN28015_c0_g1_i2:45-611(+)
MVEDSALPEPWKRAESKSHPGKFYYFNKTTGEKSWVRPVKAASSRKRPAEQEAEGPSRKRVNPGDSAPCHALHLLVKHAGSRNPTSWRDSNITISKDEAAKILREQRKKIMADAKKAGGGAAALEAAFRDAAASRSDCSSANRGGCLGFFSFPRMQKAFSEAAFALKPKQMSDAVDSDSGLHIIYRVA